MPWEILTSTEYLAVLAALDTKLTTSDVPNSLLALPIYHDAAVDDVLEIYPEAESEADTDNQAKITRAAIFFCAARLAPAVVRLTSVNIATRDGSYSRQVFDPEKRAAELRAEAEELLNDIVEPEEETSNQPIMFTTVGGNRGR